MYEFMDKIVEEPVINPYKFIEQNRDDKYILYGTGNLAEAVNKQLYGRGGYKI